jgi:CBS domain-containing protein
MMVKELMTTKVDVLKPDSSIADAARHMREHDVGAIPIEENDRLIGMITDRDIVIRAVADGKAADGTRVRDAMSQKVLYCFEDEEVDKVASNMAGNQIRRLPVVNRDKRLVGIVSLGDLALDLRTRQVVVDGTALDLSAREFALAEVFFRHPGQVLSREQLLSQVWGYDFDPGSNVVDVYVGYLRKKLGKDSIVSVRGMGYRLERSSPPPG